MTQRHLLFILALLGSLILCSPARAEVGAFEAYLGGSIGQSTLENDVEDFSFDEKDTAWRLFLGGRSGLLPILDVALEGGYRDLGDPGTTVAGQSLDVSLKGYDLSALVIFPIGPVDLFLKGGGMTYTVDSSFAWLDKDERGSGFLYGAGIGARFWKLGVRAEYELMDVDELDKTSIYWFSAYFRF